MLILWKYFLEKDGQYSELCYRVLFNHIHQMAPIVDADGRC